MFKNNAYRSAHDKNLCGYQNLEQNWDNGYFTRPHRDLSVIKSMRRWMKLNPDLSNDQLGLLPHCKE